jgi:hypothetical protein
MERKNQLKSIDVITTFIPIHDVIAVLGASIHQPIVFSSANNFKYIFLNLVVSSLKLKAQSVK